MSPSARWTARRSSRRAVAQTEIMHRVEWSAPQLVGQKVFLRIVDANTDGWGHVTFDDFTAQGRIDASATGGAFRPAQADPGGGGRWPFSPDQAVGLRSAIQDLMTTFGERYPRGAEFLARLEKIEQRLQEDADLEAGAEFAELQREALIANPLVSGQPILFIVRPQYRSSYHAIDTLFHTDEANTRDFEGGGAMKLIDFAEGGQDPDGSRCAARHRPRSGSAFQRERRSSSPCAATPARTGTSGRSTPTARACGS